MGFRFTWDCMQGEFGSVRHSSLPELPRPSSVRRGSITAQESQQAVSFPTISNAIPAETEIPRLSSKQRSPSADAINVSFDRDLPNVPNMRRSASAGGSIATGRDALVRSSRATPRRLDPLVEVESSVRTNLIARSVAACICRPRCGASAANIAHERNERQRPRSDLFRLPTAATPQRAHSSERRPTADRLGGGRWTDGAGAAAAGTSAAACATRAGADVTARRYRHAWRSAGQRTAHSADRRQLSTCDCHGDGSTTADNGSLARERKEENQIHYAATAMRLRLRLPRRRESGARRMLSLRLWRPLDTSANPTATRAANVQRRMPAHSAHAHECK